MFSLGWKTFKKQKWAFVKIAIVYFLITIVPSIIDVIGHYMGEGAEDPIFTILSICINIAIFIVGLILPIGYAYITLSAVDGKTVSVKDLFSTQGVFWKFFFASVLSTIITMIGFLLLIIPGVFASVVLIFWGYIVVDKKMSPVKALKKSFYMTRGMRWRILGFICVGILFNVLGLILLGVGLLVTVPVSTLALTHLYRHINHGESDIISREAHTPLSMSVS